MRYLSTNRYHLFIFLLLISLAVNYHVFCFGFYKDDWVFYWNSLYRPDLLFRVWLHPGTIFEFMVFSYLFGLNFILWNFLGVLLKAFASLGVYLISISLNKSTKAGSVIAAVLFTFSPLGVEAVGWSSAHVVNLMVFFAGLSFYYLLKYLTKKGQKYRTYAIFFTLFTIFLDPGRGFGLLIMQVLILYIRSNRNFIRRNIFKLVLFTVITSTILFVVFFLQSKTIGGFPGVFKLFTNYDNNINSTVTKLKIVGHFFNSVYNIISGVIINSPHELTEIAHGIYSKISAIIGIFIIQLILFILLIYSRLNKEIYNFILICLMWLLVFLGLQWAYDPNLIIASVHRYMVLPAVSIYLLLGWFLSEIKNKYFRISILIGIILLQIFSVQKYYSQVSGYRDHYLINTIWNRIENSIGDFKYRQILIMIYGEEPYYTNIFKISGTVPLAVMKEIQDIRDWPIMTNKHSEVREIVCSRSFSYELAGINIKDKRINPEDIYAYRILNGGMLIDETVLIREKIIKELGGCELGNGNINQIYGS